MISRKFLVTFALFASTLCHAQSTGYMDADTPSEAVGIMKTTITIANVLLKRCSDLYPQLAREMNTSLNKWRSMEAKDIEKTERYWDQMVTAQSKLAEQIAYAEAVTLRNLNDIASAPGDAGPKVGEQYCKQHFVNLASGIWRSRTPRTYEYLDKTP